jgi:segregation and condensation protein A
VADTILSSLQKEMEVDSPAYWVHLPDFHGPLDLLLTLIEQEDLEITAIALAKVTDQYLEYIAVLEKITPDILTEFLVVAAKLLLIKSQVLLPRPPSSVITPDEEDPTEDLIQQLRIYKRFKKLAAELDEIQKANQRSFVRAAPLPQIEPKLIQDDLDINDLLKAVRQALAVKPDPLDVDTIVSPEVITIGDQINLIRQKLTTHPRFKFSELLPATPSRVKIIVTLLATLELIKRQAIDVEQIENFGEIIIIKRDDATLSEDDWTVLSQIKDLS